MQKYILIVLVGLTLACERDEPMMPCTLNSEIFPIAPNVISAVIIEGTGPFSYIWSTGSTNNHIIVDSSISVYTVTVTDSTGCEVADTFDLFGCDQFVAHENKAYFTVKLDSACWLSSNIGTTKDIPEIMDPAQWSDLSTPAWCYFDNDSINRHFYGKLYNWHSVQSVQLCPPGYHIPSIEEWESLIEFLGGSEIAGKEMKSSFLWSIPFVGVTDSEFNAIPGGLRLENGTFINKGTEARFWTSTEVSDGSADAYSILLINSEASVSIVSQPKTAGLSCRCIKD